MLEKGPTKKVGALAVPLIPLPKVQSLGFFGGLGRETGEELVWENPSCNAEAGVILPRTTGTGKV